MALGRESHLWRRIGHGQVVRSDGHDDMSQCPLFLERYGSQVLLEGIQLGHRRRAEQW